MELNDEVLIEKWRAGDEAAATDLVRKYLPDVEGDCRQYFLDQRDVGGLALEAASAVLEKGIRLFDPLRGKFSTYLDHLIRSTCIDKLRELAGVEGHRRAKKEQLKSAKVGVCIRCKMPVRYLPSGKVAYNSDGAPHDKTCAAAPGCTFPDHISIKRSRGFKFDSSVGRAESVRTNDGGDVFDTEPWDVAVVREERHFGFDYEAYDNWYFAPRLSNYLEVIERVFAKRSSGPVAEEDDDDDEYMWGDILFDTPRFLYDIPIEYLSVMLELSKGVKLTEISNATGIQEDTIRRYFNRLKTELKTKASEKRKQNRPKADPVIVKLKGNLSAWRKDTAERLDPFKKKMFG
jgi:DNA-directed RNA polymerase specialized sigma24 family protein